MTDMNAETVNPNSKRKGLMLGLAVIVVVAALVWTAYYLLHASNFVSTDNAYAAAEIAQITPSVSGIVSDVRVSDTQAVKKGDLLVKIDPTDAQLALTQAEADFQRALRRVKSYYANDASLAAQVTAREADLKYAAARLDAAEADFKRAKIDLDRRSALAKSGSVSGDELTHAQNAYSAADANLVAARAALAQAEANLQVARSARDANATLIAGTTVENNPEVVLARARRDQAQVDLERTEVRAPVDGVIAKRTVQLGQRVQAGMPLMAVVPIQAMHVDANFKEVQLDKVRVGQPVELTADLYGSEVTYHGVVEGFSAGSGAAFAAIPAQNATGNWIKVVQRLPVRIQLDPAELTTHPLRVGLSMTAKIDTRSAD